MASSLLTKVNVHRANTWPTLLRRSHSSTPSFHINVIAWQTLPARVAAFPPSASLSRGVSPLGLSTSCSRFPKKLPVISQKVAQKLLKKSQKLLFVHVCNESFSKVTKEHFFGCFSLHLFGLMQKYANCTTKVRFLSKKCMSKYYASILIS